MQSDLTIKRAKKMARTLQSALKALGQHPGYAACLEMVARQQGFDNFNALEARVPHDTPAAMPLSDLSDLSDEALKAELYRRGQIPVVELQLDTLRRQFPSVPRQRILDTLSGLRCRIAYDTRTQVQASLERHMRALAATSRVQVAATGSTALGALQFADAESFRALQSEHFGPSSNCQLMVIRLQTADTAVADAYVSHGTRGGLQRSTLNHLRETRLASLLADLATHLGVSEVAVVLHAYGLFVTEGPARNRVRKIYALAPHAPEFTDADELATSYPDLEQAYKLLLHRVLPVAPFTLSGHEEIESRTPVPRLSEPVDETLGMILCEPFALSDPIRKLEDIMFDEEEGMTTLILAVERTAIDLRATRVVHHPDIDGIVREPIPSHLAKSVSETIDEMKEVAGIEGTATYVIRREGWTRQVYLFEGPLSVEPPRAWRITTQMQANPEAARRDLNAELLPDLLAGLERGEATPARERVADEAG